MFQKYLVTGATGFLGRAVVAQLLERKAEIHALVMKMILWRGNFRKRFIPLSVMYVMKAP